MTQKKPKTVSYRRKREGKTNYKKRRHLLLAKKPRLVIRRSNQKIIAQLIDFKTTGDVVLLGRDSSTLKKYGWPFSYKNLPAAYLTGYLLGKKAQEKEIKEAVLDLGFRAPIKGNKIYACLKGAVEAGLKVPHGEEVFPSPERMRGKHISDYAQKIKDQQFYQQKFSQYLKNNLEPTKIEESFQKTKREISSKEISDVYKVKNNKNNSSNFINKQKIEQEK